MAPSVGRAVVLGPGTHLTLIVPALQQDGIPAEGVLSRAGLERVLRRARVSDRPASRVRCIVLTGGVPDRERPLLASCCESLAPGVPVLEWSPSHEDMRGGTATASAAAVYNVRTAIGESEACRRMELTERADEERRPLGARIASAAPWQRAAWDLPEALEQAVVAVVGVPETYTPAADGRARRVADCRRVFVIGGRAGDAEPRPGTSVLSRQQGDSQWTKHHSSGPAAARWGHCAAVLGSTVYVHGGLQTVGGQTVPASPHFCRCDVDAGAGWVGLQDNPWGEGSVSEHAVVGPVRGRYLFLFGGRTESGITNAVSVFDLQTERWLPPRAGGVLAGGPGRSTAIHDGDMPGAAGPPPPRCGHTACFDDRDDVMVVFGGG
eukprot:TRINITY_DN3097_c3_g3_i2.p1 TRINITY_DN3097_c3_g3~~TRINITY_DN3097_c3_g3_i2.p1  ORF type:complete len:394 (+),score=113.13 TRINITY_DN3097_c3_g3_i2:45-1184(+)